MVQISANPEMKIKEWYLYWIMHENMEPSRMQTPTVAWFVGFNIEVGASFQLKFWTRRMWGWLGQWF